MADDGRAHHRICGEGVEERQYQHHDVFVGLGYLAEPSVELQAGDDLRMVGAHYALGRAGRSPREKYEGVIARQHFDIGAFGPGLGLYQFGQPEIAGLQYDAVAFLFFFDEGEEHL